MLTIWKFKIGYAPGHYVLKLPCESEILKVGEDPEEEGLFVVWVKCDPMYKDATENRHFHLFWTGQEFTPEPNMQYLDTFTDKQKLVWHVFEYVSDEAKC